MAPMRSMRMMRKCKGAGASVLREGHCAQPLSSCGKKGMTRTQRASDNLVWLKGRDTDSSPNSEDAEDKTCFHPQPRAWQEPRGNSLKEGASSPCQANASRLEVTKQSQQKEAASQGGSAGSGPRSRLPQGPRHHRPSLRHGTVTGAGPQVRVQDEGIRSQSNSEARVHWRTQSAPYKFRAHR